MSLNRPKYTLSELLGFSKPNILKGIQDNNNNNNLNESAVKVVAGFTSSSIAGAAVAYTLFPAEALKKYMQRHGISFKQLFSPTFLKTQLAIESFNPFKGSSLFALNIVPTTALQLTTDKVLRALMPEDASAPMKMEESAVCGTIGAITATPIENFVTRLQKLNAGSVKYSNTAVLQDLFSQGIMRPWRSYKFIATRDIVFLECMLHQAPNAAAKAQDVFGESPYVAVLAKFGVSVAGATVSHIPDTIATHLQENHAKTSAREVVRNIIARNGYSGFLAGLPPRFLLFFLFSNMIPFIEKKIDPHAEDVVRKGFGRLGIFTVPPVTPGSSDNLIQADASDELKKGMKK